MRSFLYLYKTILKNRIKKALKKPVTYIFLIFIIAYLVLVIGSLGSLVTTFYVDSAENLAIILSILTFFLLPANFISYSRRKGLLFKPSDVHFIFPAPVNPKHVLLFAGMKNLAINVVLALAVAVMGMVYFRAGIVQILIYVIFYLVLENILEGSMMILCYGNEKLPAGFFKALTVVCYALMAVFVVVAGYMMMMNTPSFSVLKEYLSLPIIQIIPIIGWNIAVIRLIFVGPTLLNIICALLFLATTFLLFVLALRAKCVGEYYEDAAKFADDYQEMKRNKQKGIVTLSMGKKKKFKKAEVEYKGTCAKAIYYRQLLEYKKSRFFIFGFNTLVSLLVGIGIAVLAHFSDLATEAGTNKIFIIPGVMAYIVFIFSGYATKWSKELENPYTFLIPDSSFKKMWYATKIEHIRAIIDGTLMAVPGAVVMGLSPVLTVLIILLYVCLMANKLYYFMLADLIIGQLLGTVGRSVVKIFLQAVVIGIAATAAVIGGILLGIEAGFAIMILVTLLLTFLGALIAATSFNKMEVME